MGPGILSGFLILGTDRGIWRLQGLYLLGLPRSLRIRLYPGLGIDVLPLPYIAERLIGSTRLCNVAPVCTVVMPTMHVCPMGNYSSGAKEM